MCMDDGREVVDPEILNRWSEFSKSELSTFPAHSSNFYSARQSPNHLNKALITDSYWKLFDIHCFHTFFHSFRCEFYFCLKFR